MRQPAKSLANVATTLEHWKNLPVGGQHNDATGRPATDQPRTSPGRSDQSANFITACQFARAYSWDEPTFGFPRTQAQRSAPNLSSLASQLPQTAALNLKKTKENKEIEYEFFRINVANTPRGPLPKSIVKQFPVANCEKPPERKRK
ncbi:hypothetical protein T12_657 [Trichinella patagoniensis]|uniref:Uncharacterized protein n=1 Tax=Trichinella patagoniensis TaxID=990121 RepID=A0A0V0Z6N8_9BILA|nr:hypothetical protein T12_657 [Trichinella patagoniensis]